MCGRFTLAIEPEELQAEFQIPDLPAEWKPRFNIAPTQPVATILDGQKHSIEFLYWGLVPSWAKDISIGSKLINARSETLQEKPSFRNAFSRRRCLILADGFYEWRRNPKGPSTPYWFSLIPSKPFAFAGLWEIWHSAEGSELKSCTIITCSANQIVQPVHDRMPVILTGDQCWKWLSDTDKNQLQSLLTPYPAEKMTLTKVGEMVNNSHVESPDLILPVAA